MRTEPGWVIVALFTVVFAALGGLAWVLVRGFSGAEPGVPATLTLAALLDALFVYFLILVGER